MKLLALATALLLAPPPLSLAQSGDTLGVHDPCIAFDHGTYYVYSTGRGLPVRSSPDLYSWHKAGRVFPAVPAWAKEKIPATTALWAPDLSYFNNAWHLYYAASSFGSDTSVIGLATSPTLDPKSPDYHWTDQGLVIQSQPHGGWNAIDPCLVLEDPTPAPNPNSRDATRRASPQPYLFFGSFWGGIQAIKLDPTTGKPAEEKPTLIPIAARPDTKSHAIEGAFVFKHDDYYYLFVSFDLCCKGIDSTYNIRVGRSKSLLGPYRDMDGRNMSSGGGTLVLAGESLMRGPGHNAALHTDAGDFLVHHIYDMNNSGQPVLQIRPILWDNDGWPLPGQPLSAPPFSAGPTDRLSSSPEGTWLHYTDTNPTPATIHLLPDHTIPDSPGATWSLHDNTLTLTWPALHSTDTLILSPDASTYVGRNQSHTLARGRKVTPDERHKPTPG